MSRSRQDEDEEEDEDVDDDIMTVWPTWAVGVLCRSR
jgi:hypothetical protein